MLQSGRGLGELKSGMRKYPQLMINVPMSRKVDLSHCAQVQDAIRGAENRLGDKGRVLLRPSGTEPVMRVMVEGWDEGMVNVLAQDLATVVSEAVSA